MSMSRINNDKQAVHDFWNEGSCGEKLYLDGRHKEAYASQLELRYSLEPYIPDFAGFESSRGKTVLEIGVGLGADHQRFAEAGADLSGVDLTERAVSHTMQRFSQLGLKSKLCVADAESLPFESNTFDIVYSWGVLHHSPNTESAIAEVLRVLKPGGEARIMIYYKYSIVGFMLWIRYGFLRLRPWTSLGTIYSRHLESPGTKAYSYSEARSLFHDYHDVDIDSVLTHGDLLTSAAGQRHQGPLLNIARRIWPRRLIKLVLPKNGLFLLVKASKPRLS